MRQQLNIREHFWRGNAPLIQIVALQEVVQLKVTQDQLLAERDQARTQLAAAQ